MAEWLLIAYSELTDDSVKTEQFKEKGHLQSYIATSINTFEWFLEYCTEAWEKNWLHSPCLVEWT